MPPDKNWEHWYRLLGGVVLWLISAQALSTEAVGDESFDCLIEPKMTVMVGAPTQGVIDSVDVARSDLVKKGQVLAVLKSNVEKAAMEHARLRATMQSEIEAREADLKLADLNMARINELFAKQMVPHQQRDEVYAQLQVARMGLRQAQDNQMLNEQEYARAKQLVEQRIIRSPISGVVVEQRAYPGEFVYENPIVTIAQLDPLKVEAILPAHLFGQIKIGMIANIDPEIQSAQPMTGVISSVDRLIDAASGTFSVHLELANPDNSIPGGQRCEVAFQVEAVDVEGGDQLATVDLSLQ